MQILGCHICPLSSVLSRSLIPRKHTDQDRLGEGLVITEAIDLA